MLMLAACGGSDGKGGCGANPTGPGCSPTPMSLAPGRALITRGSCVAVVNALCRFPSLTTSQKGDLEVTVDWIFPENSIQVLVSSGGCTLDQINGGQCPFIASTPASTVPKPRVVTARGMPPGTYQPIVGNLGPRTETIVIQVILTTGGAASAHEPPP